MGLNKIKKIFKHNGTKVFLRVLVCLVLTIGLTFPNPQAIAYAKQNLPEINVLDNSDESSAPDEEAADIPELDKESGGEQEAVPSEDQSSDKEAKQHNATVEAWYNKAETNITWNDNNAAQSIREEFFNAHAKLQFSLDNQMTWTDLNEDTKSAVGLTEIPVPSILRQNTYWLVTYKTDLDPTENNPLPQSISEEGVSCNVVWRYIEDTDASSYLTQVSAPVVDAAAGLLTQNIKNTAIIDFSASIEWRDNNNIDNFRKSTKWFVEDEEGNVSFTLENYKLIRSWDTATEAGKEEELPMSLAQSEQIDDNSWGVKLNRQPKYTEEGEPYTYYLVAPDGTIEGEADHYKVSFTNSDVSHKDDVLNNGEVETNLIEGNTNHSFYKYWSDEQDGSVVFSKRTARVYYYRVAVHEDGMPTADDIIYNPLYVEGHDSQPMPQYDSTVRAADDNSLPKYNNMGCKYVYFGVEADVSSRYKPYINNDGTTEKEGTKDIFDAAREVTGRAYIMNGTGEKESVNVENLLYEEVSVPATKMIQAAAIANEYEKMKFKIRLQKNTDDGWVNVNWSEVINNPEGKTGDEVDAVIDNFYIETPQQSIAPYKVNKYVDGHAIQYRWIEVAVSSNFGATWHDVNVGETPEGSNDPNYSEAYLGDIGEGTDGQFTSVYFKPVGESTYDADDNSATTLTNIIKENTQITVHKTWSANYRGAGVEDITANPDGILDGAYANFQILQDDKPIHSFQLTTDDYKDGMWQRTFGDGVTEMEGGAKFLPRFDDKGAPHVYTIKETSYRVPKLPSTPWASRENLSKTTIRGQISEYDPEVSETQLQTVESYSNVEGTGTASQLEVRKTWEDGNDLLSRHNVHYGIFKRSDDPKTAQPVYVGTLTEYNNWREKVTVTSYIKTGIEDLYIKEIDVNGYKNTGEDENPPELGGTFHSKLEEGKSGAGTNLLQYDYDVIVKDNTSYTDGHALSGSFNITNTRVGYAEMKMSKDWATGDAKPDGGFKVSRSYKPDPSPGDEVVALQDTDPSGNCYFNSKDNTLAYNYDETRVESVSSHLTPGGSASGTIKYLPKYDEHGEMFYYFLDEVSLKVDGEFHNFSGGSLSYGGEVYTTSNTSSIDIKGPQFHNSGDEYTLSFHNGMGDSYEMNIYKYWRDAGSTSPRPDIVYNVYRISEKSFGRPAKDLTPTELVTQATSALARGEATQINTNKRWSTGNPFMFTCTTDSVPRYDGQGYHYVYFMQEYTSERPLQPWQRDYKTMYFNATQDNHPSAGLRPADDKTTTRDAYNVPTNEMRNYKGYSTDELIDNGALILSDGYEHGEHGITDYYSGTIMNFADSNRFVDGTKIWKFPDNWDIPTDDLPNLQVGLYQGDRQLFNTQTYSHADLKRAIENGEVFKYGDTKTVTPQDNFMIQFGHDPETGHPTLPKYDDWGQPYYYYVYEEAQVDPLYPLDQVVYYSNNFNIQNTYDIIAPYVQVEVEKDWTSIVEGKTSITPVKFSLYAQEISDKGQTKGPKIKMNDVILNPKKDDGTYEEKMTHTFTTYKNSSELLPYNGPNKLPFRYFIVEEPVPNGYQVEGHNPGIYTQVPLDKYDESTSTYSGSITYNNVYTGNNTNFTLKKNWTDSNSTINNSKYRSTELSVSIHRKWDATSVYGYNLPGGDEEYLPDVRLNASNNWAYSETNANKYAPNGAQYTYYIASESEVPEQYTFTRAGNNITNTLETTSLSGTKNWQKFVEVDGEKIFGDMTWTEFQNARSQGALPTAITFALQRAIDDGRNNYNYVTSDSNDLESYSEALCIHVTVPVASINENMFNQWKSSAYKWDMLPVHPAGEPEQNYIYRAAEIVTWTNGTTECTWDWTEDESHNFVCSRTDNTKFDNAIKMVKVKQQKTFVDAHDRDNERPDELTLTLSNKTDLRIGRDTFSNIPSDVDDLVSESEYFVPIPAGDDPCSGLKSAYTMTESYIETPYIRTEQEVVEAEDGSYHFIIRNIHEPYLFSIESSKIWDDSADPYRFRPTSVEYILEYKDGITWKPVNHVDYAPAPSDDDGALVYTTSNVNQRLEVTADGTWPMAKWDSLPAYTRVGQIIEYRVQEVKINDETTLLDNNIYIPQYQRETVTYNRVPVETDNVTNKLNALTHKAQKNWGSAAGGIPEEHFPREINIKLQYSDDNGTTWNDFEGEVGKAKLTASTGWVYNFVNLRLDKMYRVIEESMTFNDGRGTVLMSFVDDSDYMEGTCDRFIYDSLTDNSAHITHLHNYFNVDELQGTKYWQKSVYGEISNMTWLEFQNARYQNALPKNVTFVLQRRLAGTADRFKYVTIDGQLDSDTYDKNICINSSTDLASLTKDNYQAWMNKAFDFKYLRNHVVGNPDESYEFRAIELITWADGAVTTVDSPTTYDGRHYMTSTYTNNKDFTNRIPMIRIKENNTWVDAKDRDGSRPNQHTLYLHNTSSKADEKVAAEELFSSVSPDEDTMETGYFYVPDPHLAEGTATATKLKELYSMSQSNLPEYSIVYSPNVEWDSRGRVYKYSSTDTYQPKNFNIQTTKAWTDGNNPYGFRPNHVKLQLEYYDADNNTWSAVPTIGSIPTPGTDTGDYVYTTSRSEQDVYASSDGSWPTTRWNNAPKCTRVGNNIQYRIKETAIDGSEPGAVYTFINDVKTYSTGTVTCKAENQINDAPYEARKIWDFGDVPATDRDALYPDSVQVQLQYQHVDGTWVTINKDAARHNLTAAEGWKYVFTNLPNDKTYRVIETGMTFNGVYTPIINNQGSAQTSGTCGRFVYSNNRQDSYTELINRFDSTNAYGQKHWQKKVNGETTDMNWVEFRNAKAQNVLPRNITFALQREKMYDTGSYEYVLKDGVTTSDTYSPDCMNSSTDLSSINSEAAYNQFRDKAYEWKYLKLHPDGYKDSDYNYRTVELLYWGDSIEPVIITDNHYYDETTEMDTTRINNRDFVNAIPMIKAKAKNSWIDAKNRDGKRQTSLQVDVYNKNNEYVLEEMLENTTESDAQETQLIYYLPKPKLEEGETVEQALQRVYRLAPQIHNGYGTIINNVSLVDDIYYFSSTGTYTPQTFSVVANKAWDDANNLYNLRAKNVTFKIEYQVNGGEWKELTHVDAVPTPDVDAGESVFSTSLLSQTISSVSVPVWTATYENLPCYVRAGQQVNYRVIETDIDNATFSTDDTNTTYQIIYGGAVKSTGETKIVTNTNKQNSISHKVVKNWEPEYSDIPETYRPASVKVQLQYNENGNWKDIVGSAGIGTLNSGNNWTYEFSNLRNDIEYRAYEVSMTYADGTVKPVNYSSAELLQSGTCDRFVYNAASTQSDTTITNRYDVTELTGTKVWGKSNNGELTDMTWIEFVNARNQKVLPQSITFTVQRHLEGEDYTYVTNNDTDVSTYNNDCIHITKAISEITEEDFEVMKAGAFYWDNLRLHPHGQENINYIYRATERLDWGNGRISELSEGSIVDPITHMASKVDANNNFNNSTPMIKVKLKSTWVDSKNRDGARPQPHTLNLTNKSAVKIGEETFADTSADDLVTANAYYVPVPTGSDIEGTLNNLYNLNQPTLTGAYNAAPTIVTYNTEDDTYYFSVIDTHMPKVIYINVGKTWEDNADEYGLRDKNVTLKVQASIDESATMDDPIDSTKWNTLTMHPDATDSERQPSIDQGKDVLLDGSIDRTITGPEAAEHWGPANWTRLSGYAQGKQVKYRVMETTVNDDYTSVNAGIFVDDGADVKDSNVVNTLTGMTNAMARKVWDRAEEYRALPDKINIKLQYRSLNSINPNDWTDVPRGIERELTASNNWTLSTPVTGLRANYAYRWVEISESFGRTVINAKDYVELDGGQKQTFVIGNFDGLAVTEEGSIDGVNTYTTSLTNSLPDAELNEEITWQDANDRDGLRPGSVTTRLFKDGAEISSSVTVENDADHRIWPQEPAWTQVPVYRNGSESDKILYTVNENPVEHYSTIYGEGVNADVSNPATLRITNTYTPKTFSITASKAWSDYNNKYGMRPTSVKFKLQYQNGDGEWVDVESVSSVPTPDVDDGIRVFTTSEVEQTLRLDGETWTGARWDNVPVNVRHGKLVEYRVVETEIDGATSSTDDSAKTYQVIYGDNISYDGQAVRDYGAVTNKLNSISHSVNKNWDSSTGEIPEEFMPESITIQLQYSDNGVDWSNVPEQGTVTINRTNDWKYTFNNLRNDKHYRCIETAMKHPDSEPVPISYDSDNLAKGTCGSFVYISNTTENTTTISNHLDVTSWNGNKIWKRSYNGELTDMSWIEFANARSQGSLPNNITFALQRCTDSTDYSYVTKDSKDVTEFNPDTCINTSKLVSKFDEESFNEWKERAFDWTYLQKHPEGQPDVSYDLRAVEILTWDDGSSIVISDQGTSHYITGATADGKEFTNTLPMIQIRDKVAWIDAKDRDGKRVNNVTLTIKNNAKEEIGSDEITDTSSDYQLGDNTYWVPDPAPSATTEQRAAALGTKYNLTESATPEYSCPGQDVNYGDDDIYYFSRTNTYEPKTFDISAYKHWLDKLNPHGQRPENITLVLQATIDDNAKIDDPKDADTWNKSIVIKGNVPDAERAPDVDNGEDALVTSPLSVNSTGDLHMENWDAKDWKGLSAYAQGGKLIKYRIVEEPISDDYVCMPAGIYNYNSTVTTQAITNTLNDTVFAFVEKSWEPEELIDIYGAKPDSISVQLQSRLKNTTGAWTDVAGDVYNLDAEHGWKLTMDIENLREDYDYRWKEVSETFNGKVVYAKNYQEGLPEWGQSWTMGNFNGSSSTAVKEGTKIYLTKLVNSLPNAQINEKTVWVDGRDRDGLRPVNTTVHLYAGGKKINFPVDITDSKEKDEWGKAPAWTYLPIYVNGSDTEKITYTLEEDTIENYSIMYSEGVNADVNNPQTLTATNIYTPRTFDVTAHKDWNDNNNPYNLRPKYVKFKLQYQSTDNIWRDVEHVDSVPNPIVDDGVKVFTTSGTEQVLKAEDNWKEISWKDLPINVRHGQKIKYRVVETEIENTEFDTEGNGVYTVIYGDDVSYSGSKTLDYGAVTNKLNGATFGVNKVWDFGIYDKEEYKELLPESIQVELQYSKDGNNWISVDTSAGKADLTEANNWSYTFTDLRKDYKYRVVEVSMTYNEGVVPVSYDTDKDSGVCGNFTYTSEQEIDKTKITNSLLKTELYINKKWDDEFNRMLKRVPAVTVNVYRDMPKDVTEKDPYKIISFELNEDNNWEMLLEQLPLYKNGSLTEKSVYTIEETEYDTEFYKDVIDNNNCSLDLEEPTYVIINNNFLEDKMPRLEVNGKKIWDDYNNQYNSRPIDGKVQFALEYSIDEGKTWDKVAKDELNDNGFYKDGQIYTTSDVEQYASADVLAKWENLPVYYNVNGTESSVEGKQVLVLYRIQETPINNYSVSYDKESVSYDVESAELKQTVDITTTNKIINVPDSSAQTGDDKRIMYVGIMLEALIFAGLVTLIVRARRKRING